MSDTIRRRRDGKILVVFESTSGFPALRMAQEKLGAERIRHAPAEMLDKEIVDGDAIFAFRQGSAAAKSAETALDIRFPKLPPNGYHIECVQHRGGRALVVIGGDLFGMLAGLADALLWGEPGRGGFVYRGGTKTEKPALALRYYWTWDHSTNWVLDDAGNQFSGCFNQYTKRPETYIEDYRRLVDHCVEMRFNGIVIWGFLRDTHGAERFSYEVAKYAADRGVAIMPGVGTTSYGGVYYQGDHPYNLETYLRKHPERAMINKDGVAHGHELSPYPPENLKFIQQSLEWLYRSFPLGGANLENGDLLVDYSAAGKRGRARIKSREADFFKDQFFAYKSALDVAHRLAPNAWNTYATYSGFGQGRDVTNAGADMGAAPYFAKRMPPSAIAQWTITGMVRTEPVKLAAWMDDPRPKALYDNPRWPKGLRPPTPRSCGFLHQASQWSWTLTRSDVAISTFAEGCLRSVESGLEGISTHGEVSSRTLTWLLNYLTTRHWSYHPVSTIEEFALAELAPRLGGQREARVFTKALLLLEDLKQDEANKLIVKEHGPTYPYNKPDPWEIDTRKFRACMMWEQMLRWCAVLNRPNRWSTGFNDIL